MANPFFGLYKIPLGFVTLIFLLLLYNYFEVQSHDNLVILDVNTEDFAYNMVEGKARSVGKVKAIIRRRNKAPVIINDIQQNAVNKEYLAIIVILVRTNTIFFESLIQSLKQATGIRKTLLIFSHDTYEDHLNEMIRNITFAKFIQIYYPHSIQLHPNDFPGHDPKFCLRDLNDCEQNNGRRNATLVQKKHHWWWTASFVFDHLKPIKNYSGTVIFLEEDQCVAKDFIFVLKNLEYYQETKCSYCNIFSLAVSKQDVAKYGNPTDFEISALGSKQELMGMGFGRTVWNEIKNSTDLFCSFNDIDWTRSLIYSLNNKSGRNCSMLSITAPRVFRFDVCATSYHGDAEKVETEQAFLSSIEDRLYPIYSVVRAYKEHGDSIVSKGHGGWDDVRDHELCRYFTRRTKHV